MYDLKYLTGCKGLKGGLQAVADHLKVERVGRQHQAGSDSFVTGSAFFKIKDNFFHSTDMEKYSGNICLLRGLRC